MTKCTDCKDSKYNCGTVIPSTCVVYTGKLPKFFEKKELCSILNINDVFEQYGEKLDLLLEQNDVKTLDKKCLGYDPATITIKKLHQIEINEICGLKAKVETLEDLLANLNIGEQLLTIDLKCFKAENLPCQVENDVYTLLSILNIIITELCLMKEQIQEIENKI